MGFLRPATPGFVVTFTATILLAIVSFCVPLIKSVFFLTASISQNGVNGSITFGTLGYCLELSNGTICSQPSVGYELDLEDINSLVGNTSPIQIPQVVVKWITTALVLHIAALIAAATSALFGLLAHMREMSTTCCSTLISYFAAVVTFVAFIFDLVLFFVAKARIGSVGSASVGSAVWLTLASWILLVCSGFFYTCGRRCISNRPSKNYNDKNNDNSSLRRESSYKQRLDAVRAEADRKARRKQSEVGLPEFPEIEPLKGPDPQTGTIHGNEVRFDNPRQGYQRSGGYAPAPPGTSTVDEFYESQNARNARNAQNAYPPQRQPSLPSMYSSQATYHKNVPQIHTPTAAYGPPYSYTTTPASTANGPSYFSAIGPRQRPNYPYNPNSNPYGEFRSSPPPHQDSSYNPNSYSLLDPPMPSASFPPTQRTANPYIIHPSPPPPPQQNHQPMHSGYTPGGDDYEARRLQPPSNPYIIHPSPPPPPQQNHQPMHSGYTPGGDDYEARRLQPPSNPYITHSSPPPTPPPPPPPPPPPTPPQQNNERRQSSCMSGDADHEIHGDKDQSDLPPVYTTMQD